MAQKILIASGKGGVGKSTVTVMLGRELASRGMKVLLIDCDAGLNSLDIMLNVREDVVFGMADIVRGDCLIRDAVKECAENLYLLPSPSPCTDAEGIGKVIGSTDGEYDYILFDAPAGISSVLAVAAGLCDRALIVATADEISVLAASKAAVTARNAGIPFDEQRLVINRFNMKAAKKSKLLNVDGVIDKSGVRLIGVIPENKDVTFMSVTGNIPDGKNKAVRAAGRITDRITGKNIPLGLKELK